MSDPTAFYCIECGWQGDLEPDEDHDDCPQCSAASTLVEVESDKEEPEE